MGVSSSRFVSHRLLDTLNSASSNSELDRTYLAAREKIQLLEGTFATLSVDLRWPTRLLALKKFMPLCLHYEERLKALFLVALSLPAPSLRTLGHYRGFGIKKGLLLRCQASD